MAGCTFCQRHSFGTIFYQAKPKRKVFPLLSGLEIKDENHPHGEIEIVEIGLRPGEKLYEELLISGEPNSTSHPRIFKAREEFLTWEQMYEQLLRLENILKNNDRDALTLFLSEIVPGYQASEIE